MKRDVADWLLIISIYHTYVLIDVPAKKIGWGTLLSPMKEGNRLTFDNCVMSNKSATREELPDQKTNYCMTLRYGINCPNFFFLV